MIYFLKNIFFNNREIIIYGLMASVLVLILKWLQWKFLIVGNSLEIYIGLISVFFTVFGVWLATRWVKSNVQKVVVEKEIYVPRPEEFAINETQLEKFKLSDREYEVLQLLAKGYSNAEIADELFLSISTIKTHVSSLLEKMDVKSRTHAVTKAQKLRIV